MRPPSPQSDGASLYLWPCDSSSRQRFAFDQATGIVSFLDDDDDDDDGDDSGGSEFDSDSAGSGAPEAGGSKAVGSEPSGSGVDSGARLCVSNANNRNTGHGAQVVACSAGEWVGRFKLHDGDGHDPSGLLELLNPPASDGGGRLCLVSASPHEHKPLVDTHRFVSKAGDRKSVV